MTTSNGVKETDALSAHFRLAPMQVSGLRKLGISTVGELLYHFPARYDESGGESAIGGLAAGAEATLFGTLHKLDTRRSWKRRIPVGEATLKDASGSIRIMWFHQPYLAKKFSEGQFVKAVGTVGGKDKKLYLANPHVELADPAETGLFKSREKDAGARRGGSGARGVSKDTASAALGPRNDADAPSPRDLFAVYPETRGVSSLWLRHALKRVFESGVLETLEDPIPEEVRERYHLPSLSDALVWTHTPERLAHAQSARKRFAFEEIFTIQVAQQKERRENADLPSFDIQGGEALARQFLGSAPFPPTAAQERAVKDIIADFEKGHPMARLLEGDVGSGKTLVAAATAYAVVNSQPPGRRSGTLQVAYMAPTEILAQQHFQSFISYFKHLPISIALITGSGCRKFPSKLSPDKATEISRSQLLKWVKQGEIAMLCGTHALIQKSVEFQHLAYAVVDEQHRFGTRQRALLAKKNLPSPSSGRTRSGSSPEACLSEASSAGRISAKRPTAPHFLSMTATPIPRTLALTLYGDLDLSLLDELPPGRAKITTRVVPEKKRADAYEAMRRELKAGRQAYVICPRIEEPDPAKIGALMAKSAKAEAARLKKDVFPEFEVGLLHGAMKPREKDAVMKRFSEGSVQVLVATSVVEVGINVPNATVILIEGAERFGLAQLHQLRGRVQRSSYPPVCFLFSDSKSEQSLTRLRVLERSDDGFKLAEADLEARGAGDLYGRKQWGVSDIGMEALKNVKLIRAAREEAERLVAADPSLSKYPQLKARVEATSRALHAE